MYLYLQACIDKIKEFSYSKLSIYNISILKKSNFETRIFYEKKDYLVLYIIKYNQIIPNYIPHP